MPSEVVQLNVRLPRTIKQQGDATLALVGCTPAKIVRQLWKRLAEGGDSYEKVARALFDTEEDADVIEGNDVSSVLKASCLFSELGESLGLDPKSFSPSDLSDSQILEELEWERLVERGLS